MWSLQHRSVNEGVSRLLRSHDLGNFVFKSICRCNNGRMAKLEDDVKPALLPLIEGRRSAASLDKNEAMVIARWAFKTTFMILPGQKTVPIPWHLFEGWVRGGANGPDPAVIFALSGLQTTRGFGYVTESDDLADSLVHPLNVRVAICPWTIASRRTAANGQPRKNTGERARTISSSVATRYRTRRGAAQR